MLVLAMEAMRSGNLVEAQRLVSKARVEYEEESVRLAAPSESDRLALVDMIQSRIDAASPAEGVSVARAAEPLSSAEVQAAARKAASQAVAAKLAAKSGPVAWSPNPETPEQQAAMEEGDAALSRTVAALSAKEFVAAYEVRTSWVWALSWRGEESGQPSSHPHWRPSSAATTRRLPHTPSPRPKLRVAAAHCPPGGAPTLHGSAGPPVPLHPGAGGGAE